MSEIDHAEAVELARAATAPGEPLSGVMWRGASTELHRDGECIAEFYDPVVGEALETAVIREASIAAAYLDLVDRVLPSLCLEHANGQTRSGTFIPEMECPIHRFGNHPSVECNCGADEHNSKIDAIIGAQK